MEQIRIDLSKYRLETALQCIKSAKLLFNDGDYKGSANRSYYAIFHAIRSVLALDGVDFKKHSAVISYFRKNYIKTGIIDVKISKMISKAFDVRSNSDYDDFYIASKSEIETQIDNAEYIYNEIEKYLKQTIKEDL